MRFYFQMFLSLPELQLFGPKLLQIDMQQALKITPPRLAGDIVDL